MTWLDNNQPLSTPYAYGNPDAVTLFGVIVEGSTMPIAFFRQRDDAEVFQREGYFYPYKVAYLAADIVEYTLDSFKPKERTTANGKI